MLAPIPSVGKAAPLLFLALQKIARTPLARLRMGYRILHGCECPYPTGALGGPIECGRLVDRNLRPIGNALLLDRILAGGIVGELLPMHLVCGATTVPLINCQIELDAAAPLGQLVDVVA